MPAALRPWRPGWLQRWLLARQPATDQHLLTPRCIYLLPSRSGWGFAAALLVLLVASINYQLNLGYALTFLLGGSGLVSAWVAQRTLQGLRLMLLPPEPVFAGETHALRVRVDNPGGRERYAIQLRWRVLPDDPVQLPGRPGAPFGITLDCAAQAASDTGLPLTFPRRGRFALPVLEIRTEFPLGLFSAWSWWRPAQGQWVWPLPEAQAPDLRDSVQPDGPDSTRPRRARPDAGLAPRSGIPDDYRAWRSGDALRRVVWRKVAKAGLDRPGQWVTREASLDDVAGELSAVWLDPALCPELAAEARISRLTAWALQAEDLGVPYAIRGLARSAGADEADRASQTLGHGSAQIHHVLGHLAQA